MRHKIISIQVTTS